jgi:ferrous iron transport protein B
VISSGPTPAERSVALVGNPNCGKTTLFNALTGSRYKVANYPGVTIERKEGNLLLPDKSTVKLFDLPGTYALEGLSVEEKIVTEFLRGDIPGCPKPDLIVAVADATNLERNLFLVSELIDAGCKLVLAVNMIDAAQEAGIKIYSELLARSLDLTVVTVSGRNGTGLETLREAIAAELAHDSRSSKPYAWLPRHHRLQPSSLSGGSSTISSPDTIAELGSLRYGWLRDVMSRSTAHDGSSASPAVTRLDRILTSRVWGFPILIILFAFVFQAIFLFAQIPMGLISSVVDALGAWVASLMPPGMLASLLVEGVIPGVGNVIIFVPQIAILFVCIGLLEDSGYLSRAAFLLDTLMRRVGLQGRAFIPLLSSFACAIPGILATRSIPSRADRLTTILIAPLMSCSARLPVYAVLIGAFVPPVLVGGLVSLQGLVLLGMYLLGVVGACAVAWVLKRSLLRRAVSFFVMEMPPLRRPIARVVLRGAYDSVISFLKNATTIILACSVIIWFLASYPEPPEGFKGNPVQASYAGQLGMALEPVIKPLGFNWEIGIGIISSFPAREVFVSTLSTIYSISEDSDEHEGLIANLQQRNREGSFSTITAVSLMVFYVFACQCMSTLAVCKRETGSWAWTLGMFVYMTSLAYLASLITYQVGSRIL